MNLFVLKEFHSHFSTLPLPQTKQVTQFPQFLDQGSSQDICQQDPVHSKSIFQCRVTEISTTSSTTDCFCPATPKVVNHTILSSGRSRSKSLDGNNFKESFWTKEGIMLSRSENEIVEAKTHQIEYEHIAVHNSHVIEKTLDLQICESTIIFMRNNSTGINSILVIDL